MVRLLLGQSVFPPARFVLELPGARGASILLWNPAHFRIPDIGHPLISADAVGTKPACIRLAAFRDVAPIHRTIESMSESEGERTQDQEPPLPKKPKLCEEAAFGEVAAPGGGARSEDAPAIMFGGLVCKFLKEADVGITEYISPQSGFFAILKHRLRLEPAQNSSAQ